MWSVSSSGNPVIPAPIGPVENWFPDSLKEMQTTVSENHPEWRKSRKGLYKGDVGGVFWTDKVTVKFNNSPGTYGSDPYTSGPGTIRTYKKAPMYPCAFSAMSVPSVGFSTEVGMNTLGAQAIAKCKPTNSAADISVMLGEILREGAPRLIGAALWRDRSRELRKRGSDEYLNYQFGWKPIVNDITKVASAIARADTIMRQYQRDSGKMVRRRFSFPPLHTVSTSNVGSGWPNDVNPSSSVHMYPTVSGRAVLKSEQLQRRWFSGAFTYYMPKDGNVYSSMRGQAQMAKKLLGLSLTPSTVWNLSPWSWAVDWFSNAGDVISNLSDWMVDSLCLHYGYMMEHTIARHTYSWVGDTGFKSSLKPSQVVITHEVKYRVRANPFGFGLTWNGLSPYQLSIATALGISRKK